MLDLTVREAKLDRDTEMLGKMDPKCILQIDGNKYETIAH